MAVKILAMAVVCLLAFASGTTSPSAAAQNTPAEEADVALAQDLAQDFTPNFFDPMAANPRRKSDENEIVVVAPRPIPVDGSAFESQAQLTTVIDRSTGAPVMVNDRRLFGPFVLHREANLESLDQRNGPNFENKHPRLQIVFRR
ncbi:MAG: hypothetical protein AB7O04_12540 [Hyphomonadaceae bacterium]